MDFRRLRRSRQWMAINAGAAFQPAALATRFTASGARHGKSGSTLRLSNLWTMCTNSLADANQLRAQRIKRSVKFGSPFMKFGKTVAAPDVEHQVRLGPVRPS
jgi:hypothetical protein